MPRVRIESIAFINFKACRRFDLQLDQKNLVVGVNNAGKSAIVGAFQVLAAALRTANARSP